MLIRNSSAALGDSGKGGSELGRGIASVSAKVGAKLISDDSTWSEESDSDQSFDVEVATSRSELSTLMKLDASARFKSPEGLEANSSVNFINTFRQSEETVCAYFMKTVRTAKRFFDSPTWSADALKFYNDLKEHPNWSIEFVKRYGDKYVDSVTIGGKMEVFFTFKFESRQEAETFRGHFDIAYGGASVAVDFLNDIRKKNRSLKIRLYGYCTGVIDAPSAGEAKKGSFGALVKYFDDFEEHVRNDNALDTLEIGMKEVYQVKRAPVESSKISLTDVRDAIDEAAEIDDLLDERLSKVKYMKHVAYQWNLDIAPKTIDALLHRLETIDDDLRDNASKIMNLEIYPPDLTIKKDDVPSVPEDWNIEELSTHKGLAAKRRVIDHHGDKVEVLNFDLPSEIRVGDPFKIVTRGKLGSWGNESGGTGNFVVSVTDGNKKSKKIISYTTFPGAEEEILIREEFMKRIKIVAHGHNAKIFIWADLYY